MSKSHNETKKETMVPKQPANTDQIIYEVMGWSIKQPAILLLQAIEAKGSINSAAKSLGMQYKTAWRKIDQLSNLLPYGLIVRRTGGSGGGGSILTDEGKRLLKRIDMMEKEFSKFQQFFSDDPDEAIETLKILRRFELNISSRNVWMGTVKVIEKGAVNSIVTVRLKGGDRICSVITEISVKRLRLCPEKEIMAIVKASNVMLSTTVNLETISARNILTGTIRSIIPGAVNDEITIDLPGGSTITSIITSASVKRLNLKAGKQISAVIKASDVIIATA